MNQVELKQYIRKIVKEQVDLRTKDGRELKEMMTALLDRQRQLDEYSDAIKEVVAKQAALKKERDLAHKVLFKRMNDLDQKTLQVADTIAEIIESPKYKRVEPEYKILYEQAYEALGRFSSEQAGLVDDVREAMILSKRSMTVTDLSVKKVQTEQFLPKIGGIVKKIIAFLFGKFGKTLQAADVAQSSLVALRDALKD